MKMSVEEKLGMDKFYVDEGNAHIRIIKDIPGRREVLKLVRACPAGLYKLNEDGSLSFDYAGCLECGTCRVLAKGTVVTEWDYPQGTFGVEFRYG